MSPTTEVRSLWCESERGRGAGDNEVSVARGLERSLELCLSPRRRLNVSSASMEPYPWPGNASALWTGAGGACRRGCAAGQSVSRPLLLRLHAKVRLETRTVGPERLTRGTGAPRAGSVAGPEWPKRRSGAQPRRRRARWWQRQRCASLSGSSGCRERVSGASASAVWSEAEPTAAQPQPARTFSMTSRRRGHTFRSLSPQLPHVARWYRIPRLHSLIYTPRL